MELQNLLLLIISLLLVVDADYLRGAPDDYDLVTNDGHRWLKLNAAQKRQRNRDRRRRKNGQKRTDEMDKKERQRKHKQAQNRKRSRVDPYEPGKGDGLYAIHRERARAKDCKKNPGSYACGFHALDEDPGNGLFDVDYLHKKKFAGNYNDNLWDDFDDP